MATRLCRATQSSGGFAMWVSKEEAASSSRPLFNDMLKADFDAIALPGQKIMDRFGCL